MRRRNDYEGRYGSGVFRREILLRMWSFRRIRGSKEEVMNWRFGEIPLGRVTGT